MKRACRVHKDSKVCQDFLEPKVRKVTPVNLVAKASKETWVSKAPLVIQDKMQHQDIQVSAALKVTKVQPDASESRAMTVSLACLDAQVKRVPLGSLGFLDRKEYPAGEEMGHEGYQVHEATWDHPDLLDLLVLLVLQEMLATEDILAPRASKEDWASTVLQVSKVAR